MILFLILLGVQQPEISAAVNRDEVVVGEALVLTILAHTGGQEPVEIVNPPLIGLQLVGSREQSRVTMRQGAPARETTRELTLRAVAPGAATIGAVRLRQGAVAVQTRPITVTVTAPDAGAGSLAPHVRALLEGGAAPTLSADAVGLTVLPSPGVVVLGEQVDVVVVAWFPRDIRALLRNPPTLTPPPVRGAWSYRQTTPSRPAMSRRVRGVWYDLYVLHDVVFPVTTGSLEIGSATVSYSVPMTRPYASREVRHEVQSRPIAVSVRAQPAAGRPSGFAGTAGTRLRLAVTASARELPIGGAATVLAEISGIGHVSLWPEPSIEWPAGLRVYPETVDEQVDTDDGFVAGLKTFRYLVVAESLGTHRVPAPVYRYFDVRTARYVTLRAGGLEFVTPGTAARTTAAAASLPPLMDAPARVAAATLATRVPPWGWALAVLLPVGLAAIVRLLARRRRGAVGRRATTRSAPTPLERLEGDVRRLLEALVPDAALRDTGALADALRAAGVDDPVAAHAARVRERLRQATYGPDGAPDPDELAAEATAVQDALAGHLRPPSRWVSVGVVLCVLTAAATPGSAQSPDRLYHAGAVGAAADSFAARAAQEPSVAAHWYNLGHARFRLGDPAGTRRAWLRAARLAPRERAIQRALALAPAPDRATVRLTWVSPVTPVEALAAALFLWLIGWLVVTVRGAGRLAIACIGFAVAAAAYAGAVAYRYRLPVGLAAHAEVPLRVAPYGPAPADRVLPEGAAVLVTHRRGPWVLVRHGNARGWLLDAELVRL